MTRKTLTRASVGLAASAFFALLVLVSGCSDRKQSLESGFEFGFKRLDSELYLRADGRKESRREVEYWNNTRLLKRVTVFYSTGGKQISVYRENGKVKLLTEWYPDSSFTVAPPPAVLPSTPVVGPLTALPGLPTLALPPAPAPAVAPTPATAAAPTTATSSDTSPAPPVEGAQTPEKALGTEYSSKIADPPSKFGKVKRAIEYGENGITVVKASFFREDGSMAAYGRLLPDSTFEQLEYTVDGKTMARHQMFTMAGDVVYMRVVVGAPTQTMVRKLPGNLEETVVFRENGIRATRTFKYSTNYEDIEFYKEDGKSLKYIVYRQLTIEALYFKADGNVDHYRSFGYDGSMTVTKYRDGAGPTKPTAVNGTTPSEVYRQYWKASAKDAAGNVTYTLDRIEEIGADGRVARRLTFSATTGKLIKVDYVNEKAMSTKVVILRDDGTVERVDDYAWPPAGGSAVITSTEVAREKGVRESFDDKLTKQVGYEDVRTLVGPPIEPPYYDYEGDHF